VAALGLNRSELNLEPCGHAIECFPVDAEDLRGPFPIIPGGFQDVQDVAALNLIEIR
jgi:hypothetical protein